MSTDEQPLQHAIPSLPARLAETAPSAEPRYEVYVDGSPGPRAKKGWSGWGVVMMAGSTPIYQACGVTAERISSNAIELEACIQGLAYIARLNLPVAVVMWTDSAYAADIIARLAEHNQRGFCDRKGFEIKNADRVKMLFDMLYRMGMINSAIVRWTKGHNDTPGNEIADKLSKEAAYNGQVYYTEHPKTS